MQQYLFNENKHQGQALSTIVYGKMEGGNTFNVANYLKNKKNAAKVEIDDMIFIKVEADRTGLERQEEER